MLCTLSENNLQQRSQVVKQGKVITVAIYIKERNSSTCIMLTKIIEGNKTTCFTS